MNAPTNAFAGLLLVTLTAVGCTSLREPQPAPIPPPPTAVFDQSAIGAMSCGPCALYHALRFGPPAYRAVADALVGDDDEGRVRGLIARHGSQPSADFPAPRVRYDDKGGTTPNDLVAMATGLLAEHGLPAPRGVWLDREDEEPASSLVRRVHAVIRGSDLPPVIDVRSFIADVKDEGEPLWEGQVGHFLTVVDVDPLPPSGPVSGFLMRCADSVNGRVIPVFAAVERHRPFIATRGFTVDDEGDEVWEWVYNSPYLLLTIPDLNMRTGNATWFERTTMTLKWVLVANLPAPNGTARAPS